ncbi:AMP-binding protein [Aeromicrobium sp. Leaf350]|uniref:AMP-binding protein n=1 Tax=Aeromicrobium sp. Leaf350 TaxID=2876565 RepID=UPI001E3695B5|nr:AMP-binding protein [Aeromicrobium sp. Leaf350]
MTSLPIGRAFTVLAEREPDRPAVTAGGCVVTRARLESLGNRLARTWAADGVGRDDLVTISLSNGLDLVLACVAAWKLGAIPQPLSPRLPAAERLRLLATIDPRLVVDGPVEIRTKDDAPLPDAVASSWKAPTSSGSTGVPKLLLDPNPSSVDVDRPVAPFVPRDVVQLVAGPLFHAAPFTYAMRGLMTGHELVLMERFDAGAALAAIERHRVGWTMLVPTTMARIWRHPARASTDVSSLHSVMHMAARCPEPLKRDWIDWLGAERVVEVYAGTEAQGLTMIRGDEWLVHPGSVGRPMAGSRFRAVRPDGSDCAPGEVGELRMQRDGGRPGWHGLGDAGWVDADGYVFVADRLDDAITVGGVTVHPADVEAVVDSHPGVRSSVAVGRPDPELGEVVHVLAESDVDPGLLLAWVRERVDPEKRPRTLETTREPLRDDTGKTRRARHR